ncbi:MAG: 5'/3'-nucleotidase SurE [Haloglomus sp.]
MDATPPDTDDHADDDAQRDATVDVGRNDGTDGDRGDRPHVLLTNDDGVDSPGLAALRDALADEVRVTVVAPTTDHSGVGRARSDAVEVTRRDTNVYAVDGTPADCAAFGLRGLEDRPDLVVSGCNVGPNFDAYILGHSGTVAAAVEAAFLGTPAIAVSAYDPTGFLPDPDDTDDYALPAAATRHLVTKAFETAVFDSFDDFDGPDSSDPGETGSESRRETGERVGFLNVNAPAIAPRAGVEMRVTLPLTDYDTRVERDGDTIRFRNTFWASADVEADLGLENPPHLPAHDPAQYPEESERHAILAGDVSVTPLTAPHGVGRPDALDALTADWRFEEA